MATNNSLNTLVSGADLVSRIMGGESTTTTTGSRQSNISQQGVDRLISQILAGPGGVKSIGGAARGAGLYNSSTEAQMLNDLSTRAAGEVEARRAGETTTQTATTQTEGADLGTLGLAATGLMLGKPLIERALGLGGAELATAGAGAITPAAGLTMGGLGSMASGLGIGAGAGASLAGLTGGSLLQGSGALAGAGSGAAGLAADLGLQTAGSGALDVIPGVGSFLGGLFGGKDGSPFDSGGSLLSSAGMGMATMGPPGAIIAPLAGLAGNFLGKTLGIKSIVCTALRSRGLLDEDKYKKGQAYLQTLNKTVLAGYYYLFTNLANKITGGDSKAIKLALPWARSRTNLISDESKYLKYFKYPLGTLTIVVGQPVCWVVGKLTNEVEKSYG